MKTLRLGILAVLLGALTVGFSACGTDREVERHYYEDDDHHHDHHDDHDTDVHIHEYDR